MVPGTVAIGVHIYVYPHNLAEFTAILTAQSDKIKSQPGCIGFQISQAESDPTVFFLWEQWESKQALERVFVERHAELYTEYEEKTVPMWRKDREIVWYNVMDY